MRDWKIGKISDLIQGLESGVSVNGSDHIPEEHEKAVLKVSAVTYGLFNAGAAKPILHEEISRAKCNPKKGQIIISRSNTPELVGASAFVDKDYPERFLPDKLWQTVPKKNYNICMKWLAFTLASPKVRFNLSMLATGSSSSMKNITKSEFLSQQVLIPPFKEQKAIADTLQTWDTAIEKTEALIAAKEKKFAWLNSIFFTPSNGKKTMLFKIGDFIKRRNEKVLPSNDIPLFSLTIEDGVTAKTARYNREFLVKNCESKMYKVAYPKDIVFNPANLRWGAIARSNVSHKVALSPIYEVYEVKNNKINNDYLTFALTSQRQINFFATKTEGTLIERMAVKASVFELCKIIVPSLCEQKTIAETLNRAQQEIALLKQLVEKYRVQKQGLMQKLLTGQIRLQY